MASALPFGLAVIAVDEVSHWLVSPLYLKLEVTSLKAAALTLEHALEFS